MTLYDTIRTAILEHSDRETVVYLADGREIVVAPDLGSVKELAAEITAAVLARFDISVCRCQLRDEPQGRIDRSGEAGAKKRLEAYSSA
ncbi:hypothetical protein [Methylorubrum thiocyanatum]|uniref:hypothetical protein n=1 Tax=Methylorubrum thiocyanatum TaxID=47958 RepID=UPI003F7EC499